MKPAPDGTSPDLKGDVRGDVTQVPHAQLMADVFGAEGDVAGILQFSAHLQVDRIRCIQHVAASLQNSRLDDKTIGWGATGKSAWDQNRLFGAPRLRQDRVELDKRHNIHPKAILQPAREANLRLVPKEVSQLRWRHEPGHLSAEHRLTPLGSPPTRPQWTGRSWAPRRARTT